MGSKSRCKAGGKKKEIYNTRLRPTPERKCAGSVQISHQGRPDSAAFKQSMAISATEA